MLSLKFGDPAVFLWSMVVAVFAFLLGRMLEHSATLHDAIEHNAGRYIVDDETGAETFRWGPAPVEEHPPEEQPQLERPSTGRDLLERLHREGIVPLPDGDAERTRLLQEFLEAWDAERNLQQQLLEDKVT